MSACVIGVDVGSGSARAGVFDGRGRLLGSGVEPFDTHHAPGGRVEQSSDQIWASVCTAVRRALDASGAGAGQIRGIGFDAACSMAVIGIGGDPLPVGDPDRPDRNVIVWMDHRATAEAEEINAGSHEVLDHVGGRISPEMQTPKLLWLKRHRPETYEAAAAFLDLADFLTWRATGSFERSSCTLTCKWTWLPHEDRWDPGYFRDIGLGDQAADRFARIGDEILPPGDPVGAGLTAEAAAALGLAPGTPVGAGLIDAHAGGLGAVGGRLEDGAADPVSVMAYVFGTSSCTMTSTRRAIFAPGVWGPYRDAMVPGLWLLEGGQSAAGAAVARLIQMHPAAPAAAARAKTAEMSLPDWLALRAAEASPTLPDAIRLAHGLHAMPEFLGNRAPFADPSARALIAGLGMEADETSLIALYISALSGIGSGLRQIIEAQRAVGAAPEAIVITGGAGRDRLVRQILADASGLPVMIPATEEPVLLGAAMLGAVAGGVHADLRAAMPAMSAYADRIEPAGGEIAAIHDARFKAFELLQRTGRELRALGA